MPIPPFARSTFLRFTPLDQMVQRATLALVCQLAPKECVNAVRSTDLAGGAAP